MTKAQRYYPTTGAESRIETKQLRRWNVVVSRSGGGCSVGGGGGGEVELNSLTERLRKNRGRLVHA